MEIVIGIIGAILALFGYKSFRGYLDKHDDAKFKASSLESQKALVELVKSLTKGEEDAKLEKEQLEEVKNDNSKDSKESTEEFFNNRYNK
jgi:Tfp pilus assembly protein PilE